MLIGAQRVIQYALSALQYVMKDGRRVATHRGYWERYLGLGHQAGELAQAGRSVDVIHVVLLHVRAAHVVHLAAHPPLHTPR